MASIIKRTAEKLACRAMLTQDDGSELIDLRLTRDARPQMIVIPRRHTLPEGEECDRVFVHVTHLLVVSGVSVALMLQHRPPPIDRGAGSKTGVCDS